VKILVVEDDRKLARFLQRVLSEEGHVVDCCASGAHAFAQASSGVYGVMVLDWMIPDFDGLEVCRKLREAGNHIAILMLSARGGVAERVMALEVGADDYLTKPFEIDELNARVKALTRRTSGEYSRPQLGPLTLDRIERRAIVDGREVEMTPREFNVLVYLALRPNQLVTRTELLAQVWETHFDPESNVVDVCMNRVRDKLGQHAWMIETVRGRGYRLRTQKEP
jgi:DNA-binding response OmpR family regulator